MKKPYKEFELKEKRPLHQHELSYFILRLSLGVNIFMHGMIRLTQSYYQFTESMAKAFEDTFLPQALVRVFAWSLPPIETLLGFLLLAGLYTRTALITGAALLIALIFGKCIQQDWTTVGIQMIYMLFYYILIDRVSDNRLSLDTWVRNRRHPEMAENLSEA